MPTEKQAGRRPQEKSPELEERGGAGRSHPCPRACVYLPLQAKRKGCDHSGEDARHLSDACTGTEANMRSVLQARWCPNHATQTHSLNPMVAFCTNTANMPIYRKRKRGTQRQRGLFTSPASKRLSQDNRNSSLEAALEALQRPPSAPRRQAKCPHAQSASRSYPNRKKELGLSEEMGRI